MPSTARRWRAIQTVDAYGIEINQRAHTPQPYDLGLPRTRDTGQDHRRSRLVTRFFLAPLDGSRGQRQDVPGRGSSVSVSAASSAISLDARVGHSWNR